MECEVWGRNLLDVEDGQEVIKEKRDGKKTVEGEIITNPSVIPTVSKSKKKDEKKNNKSTFFKSKYLNQNGGHWSDQYK